MFGKRETAKFNPSEYRVHDRQVVRNLKVFVDKQKVNVLDYSDGGVRVEASGDLPRVAVIEVYRNDKLIKNVAAVIAWERGGQVGYAFRAKQKLTHIAPKPRAGLEEEAADQNVTGGVAGSALKRRLKL